MTAAPPVRSSPALARRRECLVAGVAGGLADHLGWPVPLVRVVFVATALLGGAGALLYAWLWAFTPWADASGPDDRVHRRAPVAVVLTVGAVLAALVAIVLSLAAYSWSVPGAPPWLAPVVLAVLLALAAAAWVGFIDRPDPERGRRTETAVRAALTVALGALAIALLLGPALRWWPYIAVPAALGVLIGIGLVYAPGLVRVWRDLNDERVRRIRDEQRSAMAAHLHDSVLQTLALIQNRAGASSEAGRLARAQERELRSWLFEGEAPADSDLATDLRDYAAALELDYPVRIEVVAVGMSDERASGEVAAAAREAMLNAARHAGGEVSVYLEGSPTAVDVYVRDRGPGFDPTTLPDDRLGVRESIIGRMRRVGGRATVRPGADGTGTEVHLRFETEPARA
ncbi:PspC domain-containing protein [Agromyces intestinalis]|uniref:PspC domain-containing protein n=1 Tax=Agromyces intestinalis TaxID=2592652 RepID=A0A5C1YEY8_9MICO|nr:ATP-binding protein [Agromyces intestinalis]QEO14055.1 PspC domain-containing protein [Agromyces intestinalis]